MANPMIEMAEKLGRAISESSQAATLRTARKEMDQHQDLKDLLKQYQEQYDKVRDKEEKNQPVEVDDKRSLQELHGKLVANDVFKKFTVAQLEYVDLMRQVTTALRKQLAETETE